MARRANRWRRQSYPLPAQEFDVIVAGTCWSTCHTPSARSPTLRERFEERRNRDPRRPERSIRQRARHQADTTSLPRVGAQVAARQGRRGNRGKWPVPDVPARRYSAAFAETCRGEAGLGPVYISLYEGNQQRRLRARFHVTGRPWAITQFAIRVATVGFLSPDLTDCFWCWDEA